MTEGTRCTGMSTTAFFAGLVAGIGTGLLLAPQSGARTRRQLHSLTQDLQEETSHMLERRQDIDRQGDRAGQESRGGRRPRGCNIKGFKKSVHDADE